MQPNDRRKFHPRQNHEYLWRPIGHKRRRTVVHCGWWPTLGYDHIVHMLLHVCRLCSLHSLMMVLCQRKIQLPSRRSAPVTPVLLPKTRVSRLFPQLFPSFAMDWWSSHTIHRWCRRGFPRLRPGAEHVMTLPICIETSLYSTQMYVCVLIYTCIYIYI